MLLLKKQLCEKFEQFEEIKLDDIPRNISKKINFIQGQVELGRLEDAKGIASGIKPQYFSLEEGEEEVDEDTKSVGEVEEPKNLVVDKATQIGHRDFREILGEKIKESEVQTDIRMIHDLQAPNKFEILKKQQSLTSRFETKECQTDPMPYANPNHPPLSSQLSVEDDPNAPIDRNKLGKRVRRYVRPGCSIAVLPTSEIIIVDPEANFFTVLDRRGKFRFGLSNTNKPCTETGHQTQPTTQSMFNHLPKLEKGIRINTPQGNLIIKLENEPQQPSAQSTTTSPNNSEVSNSCSDQNSNSSEKVASE
jgi:hypothetical protein